MENLFKTDHHFEFLKSAFSTGDDFKLKEVYDWIINQKKKINAQIQTIPFAELKNWGFDNKSLRHESGKFFSIDGIRVKTNWGTISEWDQPIINQPEIGYLGFIVKEFNGVLNFLIQAKVEPGNVNFVQISPTLQATKSNYTQVHKGKKPLYLEYFLGAKPDEILLDQLQSEQGARFLRKRNRNIIVKVDKDIPVYDNFMWVTLSQLKQLMLDDNLVNMDTRTVVSGLPFGSFESSIIDIFNHIGFNDNSSNIGRAFFRSTLTRGGGIQSIENIITFIAKIKSNYNLEVNQIPLGRMNNWIIGKDFIHHEKNKYFKINAVKVSIGNREVTSWTQPMIAPAQQGLCAFVVKEINGILHFAVQAKLECGNHDIIELAPTVQCLTGNYKQSIKGRLPFLDYVLNAKKERVVIDTLQSEEGGRFFREENRNMIVLAEEDIPVELPDNYIWMTLNQINTFLKFNNFLNIQARSLISLISFK